MNLFFVIFPGICGLIGVIFTAIGVGITRNRRRKEQLCTMYTTGTVVDVVRRVSHSSGSSSVSWHPVFSYYAGGQQIVKESHFGNSKPQFTVGQTVQVYYDPYDPERYYVAERSAITWQRNLSSSCWAGSLHGLGSPAWRWLPVCLR